MTTPTAEEIAERSAWIAARVMGWKRMTWDEWMPGRRTVTANHNAPYWFNSDGTMADLIEDDGEHVWSPYTSPADAMAVLKKCLPVIPLTIEIGAVHFGTEPSYFINQIDGEPKDRILELTLEAAICEFARQLFEKGGE